MNITGLISKGFIPRQRALQAYDTQAESLQDKQLKKLLAKACHTEWGQKHDYRTIHTYEEYARRVPIQSYEDIKPEADGSYVLKGLKLSENKDFAFDLTQARYFYIKTF